MATLSNLKSRRLKSHKGETTQQIIIFPIDHEWFALPIFAVKKVVTQNDISGNYYHSGNGLTVYEGKELLVVDISHRVFGQISKPTPSIDSPTPNDYLLIIQNRQQELVGLPIRLSPSVRKVAESAIVPLPANYAARVNIQCVSGLIIQSENAPILFLLNPEQLLQSQPLLPPTA
ncbi:MAG: chemotaxis protein CheW [Cyanobacteria bacterium P01_C01_bin.118]